MDEQATAGRLMLVGLGPGGGEHMTQRAREAIAEADTVVGYVTYVRLIAGLCAGKEVIAKPMAAELDRVLAAVERARAGRTVALVSSGDPGIYGMAGLTFEVLFQAGWTPPEAGGGGIAVEIVPGASALNTCAALAGAPLSHDFCAISLSDLLTPWAVIARRLDAAAAADFVVALYNPGSRRRSGQIVEAQRLLLRHRDPATPVALVESAYRPRQRIQFTTLAQMAEAEIGMLTTVIVGNSQTLLRHGVMVTPRGYGDKYALDSGAARAGERPGLSLSDGLVGWRNSLKASGETAAQLAALHGLPVDYVAGVLAEAMAESGGPLAEKPLPAA